jgi:hypothetical protein
VLNREGQLVALGIGPQESVHAVFALRKPDMRIEQSGGAIFFKTKPDRAQAYRIETWKTSSKTAEVHIAEEEFNITSVQPLGDDLLLVCPRCNRTNPDDVEKNGRIYTSSGFLKRELVLGDGIEQVYVASDQTIWTSYFDEGVFGNYGWDEPLGASGLVQWSPDGDILYEFTPSQGLDYIADCYAMNVDFEGDVWCCYYTDFPLVRIHDHQIRDSWDSPVEGSHAFAVDPPFVLFLGSYNKRDEFYLVELLAEGKSKIIGQYTMTDHDGKPLEMNRVETRGPHFHIVSGSRLYTVGIDACRKAG